MEKLLSIYKGSLGSLAFKPEDSYGRRFANDLDVIYESIDPFLVDRESIRLGKFYRRLDGKTQVFPPGLHTNIRNRLIHTNDVVNLCSIFASILGLNVYLAEAIAYGHDIGHTPFGHLGETLIRELSEKDFAHNVMSVVVAQKIERKGKGMNLIYETLDGMEHHSSGKTEVVLNPNVTQEASLAKHSDKIAYTFSDLNDTLKVGFLTEGSLPSVVNYFGKNQRERIAKVSFELIKESSEEGKVSFSKSECAQRFAELRSWMFKNVYLAIDKQDYKNQIEKEFKEIYSFLERRFDGAIDPYLAIACMTDNEVGMFYNDISIGVKNFNYGFLEIINNLLGKEINIFDPDLNKSNFSKKYL